MKYRIMGKDKEEVSILGFGCMRLPIVGGEFGKIDEDEAIKQIRYAIDHGVNYIDTAYPYHGGTSEGLVGKALADGYRKKVHLATKLPSWLIHSREDMDYYLNIQLERLQTDCIDFYLLHTLNKKHWSMYLENGVFEFIKKAQADGKIKNIGFSFHDELPLFKEIVDAYDWDFCQIQLNYIDDKYQAGLEGMYYASEKGLDIIVMEPIRGGQLAQNIPEDIQRIWDSAEQKFSPAEWALRYLWNYPEVKVVLSGMGIQEHVEENIKAASRASQNMLTKEEKEIIHRVRELYLSRMQVNCTSCQYCMPCPFGVNIPLNFARYNDAFVLNDIEFAKNRYNRFTLESERANMCQSCGACETHCPQNIPIIEALKKVSELFD